MWWSFDSLKNATNESIKDLKNKLDGIKNIWENLDNLTDKFINK
jgi:hypothetical protein